MSKRLINKSNLFVISFVFILQFVSAHSPTENYLKHITPGLIEEKLWGTPRPSKYKDESVNKYMPVISKVIAKEKELQATHYPFYNATMLDYLIIKDLFKKLQCKIDKVCWVDFEQLRAKGDLFKSMKSIDDFFEFRDSFEDKTDHNLELRKVLASVNLSFPGAYEHAESTFFYFTAPVTQLTNPEKSYREFIKSMLMQFDQIKKLPEEKIKDFVEKIAGLRSYFSDVKSGLLYQIFIPKNLVDTYVYLTEAYGFPYGYEKAEYGQGGELIDEFPNIWDEKQQKFTKISPILDLFQSNPDKMPFDVFEAFQARVVLSKDLFASPDSGVKIVKHHMIGDSALAKLNAAMDEIAQAIIDESEKH